MLYDHPELYDRIYGGFAEDIPLFRELASQSGGPVCDLACGTGRVASALTDVAQPIVGVDLSDSMLNRARAGSNAAAVTWRRGDMRDPLPESPDGRPYRLVILALHSLEHLTATQDLIRALSAVRDALDRDGRLVCALHNPEPRVLGRQTGVLERVHPGVNGLAVYETTTYAPVRQLLKIEWFVEMRQETQRFTDELRMIFPQEVNLLLQLAGLRLEGHWSWYNRAPLTDESGTQIVVARPA